ncbi:ATP-binding cassette sub-family C member 4-like [Brevipalpus obovatus]|uniref:ATP-binding cassette sub-family C member 4-like n=1 Tax=Brevipalpus obovatus TaxID=246614 RepID=UPI003D9F2A2B
MYTKKFHAKWPADEASYLSRIFLIWTWPLFHLAHERTLNSEDLYNCSEDDDCERWSTKLKRTWDLELERKRKPSLFWAVILTFGPRFLLLISTLGILTRIVIPISQTFFLGWILDFLSGKVDDMTWALMSIIGFCSCAALQSLSVNPLMYANQKAAQRIRASIQKLLMDKLLVTSTSAIHTNHGAQLINLVTNDVSRFDQACLHSPGMILCPLQTVLISIILWNLLGNSYIIGLVVIIGFMFLQFYLGPKSGKVRSQTAAITDHRIRLMSQIINGMKVIKMYSWEDMFSTMMKDIRTREVKKIRKACMIRAINLSLSFVTTRVILFLCLATHVLMGNELTAKKVFVSIALLIVIKGSLTVSLSQGFAALCESYASLRRIQDFLQLEEVSSPTRRQKSPKNTGEAARIEVTNMTSYWTSDCKQSCLYNISFKLSPGELLTVVGPVGSGKTSLLLSLMGEIHVTADRHLINGFLSYAAQDPWILNTSIRENILFGKPYDEERYNKVLSVTTLDRDMKMWPNGDKRLAGERGVALSGGQKVRISLARAIYRDVDIYLLDDPLSAVDSHVARHIFERCIKDFLKAKIVILVTHQLHFLSNYPTKILVLNQYRGRIFNNLEMLLKSDLKCASLVDSHTASKKEHEHDDSAQKSSRNKEIPISLASKSVMSLRSSGRRLSLKSNASTISDLHMNLPVFQDLDGLPEEQQKTGSVRGKIYWDYFKLGSGISFAISTFIVNIASQILYSSNDMWLAHWTDRLSNLSNSPAKFIDSNYTISSDHSSGVWNIVPASDISRNILLYFTLVTVLFLTTLLRAIFYFQMSYRASISLHNSILEKILKSPICFFEENPAGRILNRFAQDLGTVDETLPVRSFDVILNLLLVICVFIVISTTSMYMIFPGLLIVFIIMKTRSYYIPAARDIKRIEAIARSPVYSHLADTVDGLATIRTFAMEKKFRKKFALLLNHHSASWNTLLSVSRALSVWINWITLIYTLITMICTSLMYNFHLLLPGSAGLVLTQILSITTLIQFVVITSVDVESLMTSVERVLEYTELEIEPTTGSDIRPPSDWPEKGAIKFENVTMKYPSAPKPALSDISIRIDAGEKVGVVGRTGAGKSSLLSCLFRLVEPEGVIEIDEIDIKSIGLRDLRQKISIIPQEPVLFSGTVRFNLDPFNRSKDSDLWEALENVQLKEKVSKLEGSLEHEIREGGDNFSVGERQLICLARALLRNNKILVVDEVTANVDQDTDELIQQTIRTKFANCTVITIAHRLNTIIDFDRILVLNGGKVVEFDEPHILLQRCGSAFFDLVSKTDQITAQKLILSARKAFERKHKGSISDLKLHEDSLRLL